MNVDSNDLWTMLLSMVRYAMGRQSYITSAACEMVLKYKESLTIDQLKQIVQEVRERIDQCEARNIFLGSKIDHENWIDLVVKLVTALALSEED